MVELEFKVRSVCLQSSYAFWGLRLRSPPNLRVGIAVCWVHLVKSILRYCSKFIQFAEWSDPLLYRKIKGKIKKAKNSHQRQREVRFWERENQSLTTVSWAGLALTAGPWCSFVEHNFTEPNSRQGYSVTLTEQDKTIPLCNHFWGTKTRTLSKPQLWSNISLS